jgi:hypothetical protein
MFGQYTGLFLPAASDEGQKQQKKDAQWRPFRILEREKSLELSTSTLARLRSTN